MKEEELKKHIDIIYDHWYETNRFYHILAKQYGITDLTLFTLGLIYYNKECPQNMVTEKLCIPKQTSCSLLNGLEKKGYITRKINAKDKRNKIITLTKKGIKFAEPILEKLEKLDTDMLASLKDEDIVKYTNCLKELIKFMENYSKD